MRSTTEMRFVMRWRYRHAWGHVRVRVFAGFVPRSGDQADFTLGKAGDLVFREDEWREIVAWRARGIYMIEDTAASAEAT